MKDLTTMTIGIGLIMVGWKFKERKKAFNFRNNRRCGRFRCLQHYVCLQNPRIIFDLMMKRKIDIEQEIKERERMRGR